MYFFRLLIGFFLINSIRTVPVNNGVVGDPMIECGDNSIGVTFATRNPFQGHIFVKEQYAEPNCRTDATGNNSASIQLAFISCGVLRIRSTDPRGVFVTVSLIIAFHPRFITKVDRAYMVQCYYMEMEKIVTTELQVSMLPTSLQTVQVLMPTCRYEVLSGGPSGQPVLYARIGEQVYHKWTCDTESVGTFCMFVHSCQVDDGTGDVIPLIDKDGCALDMYALGNLDYVSDLMAGKEAHVFKYADRPNLYFDCQISISIKEPGRRCGVSRTVNAYNVAVRMYCTCPDLHSPSHSVPLSIDTRVPPIDPNEEIGRRSAVPGGQGRPFDPLFARWMFIRKVYLYASLFVTNTIPFPIPTRSTSPPPMCV